MNIFHRIGNAWEGFWGRVASAANGTPAAGESVNYNFLACAGFLIVIGFAALLCWTLKGVLSTDNLALLASLVKQFLWIYGAIMIAKIAGNTLIIVNRQQLAYKDGTLTDTEERALESGDRAAGASIPAGIPTQPAAGAPQPKS